MCAKIKFKNIYDVIIMNKIEINIRKPDDGAQYYVTYVKSDLLRYGNSKTVSGDRSAKDPLHTALKNMFKEILKQPRANRWGYSRKTNYFGEEDFTGVFWVKECPIALSRTNGKFRLNGKAESMDTIANAFARVAFKSCFTDDNSQLMQTLFSSLSLSEDIKYVLENRVPYHYFRDFEKQDVRLNVAQIGDKEFAIEIGDGVWGNISMKDLQSFCNYYIHGKKNSKFRRMGLKRLYEALVGREPLDSDIKVMREFLAQNRTEDLIENRAKELLKDITQQYPDRIKLVEDDNNEPETMYIVGNDYDWMLSNSRYKSDIQMVSTFVRQKRDITVDDETTEEEWFWSGPICIDNMARGSSLGDQFATRAFALLNDNMTVARVSTIKGYLNYKPNENERVDINEVHRM
tara:strand:- start:859 stop:2070 length:1212 start_codon:yes stop_codon:yes gene_type:complete